MQSTRLPRPQDQNRASCHGGHETAGCSSTDIMGAQRLCRMGENDAPRFDSVGAPWHCTARA
eukprot:841920-Alexandrium_andersonii.AAC.1